MSRDSGKGLKSSLCSLLVCYTHSPTFSYDVSSTLPARTAVIHLNYKPQGKRKTNGFKNNYDLVHFTLGFLFIYFVLWSPSIVYYTMLSFCPHIFPSGWNDSAPEKKIVFIIKMLSYVSGLFSPLFYTSRNHGMKQFLKASVRSKMRILRVHKKNRFA